jgi:hypothetical protein
MGWVCSRYRESKGLLRVLVGNREEKRPLGGHMRRWEDNIKMDLQELGCGRHGMDRAGSGLGQLAGTCKCRDEPSGSIKCGEFLD